VVVVADAFEVHDERRVSVEAESGGGEERSFEAVTFALAEGSVGGPGCVGILVGECVEEALNFYGRIEGAQGASVFVGEAKGGSGGFGFRGDFGL
jgi:hypothetical protein